MKYCTNCVWSTPKVNSDWTLNCTNPKVNAKDPWALSSTDITGSSCREERAKTWFAPCGRSGKLYKEI